MNTDTVKNPVKVVLDTNIIISAVGFSGKPQQILLLAFDKKIYAFTSNVLLAELEDVVNKKFPELAKEFEAINELIQDNFIITKPKDTITILLDDDDNRVLEAALEGEVDFIITGDKQLLKLKKYQNIKIVSPDEFLDQITYKNL